MNNGLQEFAINFFPIYFSQNVFCKKITGYTYKFYNFLRNNYL